LVVEALVDESAVLVDESDVDLKFNVVHLKRSPWKFGDSELGTPSFFR